MSDKAPIDEMPPVVDVFGTSVASVDVVSVFPDIDNKDRTTNTLKDGVAEIVAVEDVELALSEIDPDPARSKVGSCTLGELLLELVHTAKRLGEELRHRFGDLVGFLVSSSSKTRPVEVVVEQLAGVVADAAFGLRLHDAAQTHVGIFGLAGNKLGKLGSIGVGVLAVVVLDGLGADVGGKSVFGVLEGTGVEGGHG